MNAIYFQTCWKHIVIVKIPIKKRRSFVKINMMEQKLRLIAEELKIPHTNLGLLRGKMGKALFFYHYTRHIDCRKRVPYTNN